MSAALAGLSSMATKHLLAELAAEYESKTGTPVSVTSMGGVDAAARVRAGEGCDFVVLAKDAIAKLEAEGHVAGTRTDIAHASIAVAVPAAAPAPDLSTEDAVRDAVMNARAVGYSTGPSGVHLLRVFERWGVKPRLVQAPPGIGVGELIRRGEVTLGFQQLSELIHLDGIRLAGALPAAIQSVTTFCGAVCASSARHDEARAFLASIASGDRDAWRRHGLQA